MFNGATLFNGNISILDVSKVEDMTNMFVGTSMSIENYNELLYGWGRLESLEENIFTSNGLIYNDLGKDARDSLISNGWTIQNDVYVNKLTLNITEPFTLIFNNPSTILQFVGDETRYTSLYNSITNTSTFSNINLQNTGNKEFNIYNGENIVFTGHLYIFDPKRITLIYDFSTCGEETFQFTLPISSLSESIDVTNGLTVTWGGTENIPIRLNPITEPLTYRYTDIENPLTVTIIGNNVKGLNHLNNSAAPYLIIVGNVGNTLTSLSHAFHGCTRLGNIMNIVTNNVNDLSYMFYGVSSYTFYMSSESTFSRWNVSNVTNMSNMFNGATLFQNYVPQGEINNWDVSKVTDMTNMLTGTSTPSIGYNNLLIEWCQLESLQSNVPLGVQGLIYTNKGKIGRDILVSSPNNWIITGDLGIIRTINTNQYILTFNTSNTGLSNLYVNNVLYSETPSVDFTYNWESTELELTTFTIKNILGTVLFENTLLFKLVPEITAVNNYTRYMNDSPIPFPQITSTNNMSEFILTSNSEIIEINYINQTMIIKGVGIATITILQESSDNFSEGIQSFNITVVEPPTPIPCLKEGTKVLTEEGYKEVEKLTKEDKVKTVDGYKNVYKISKTIMEHRAINKRIPDQLYEYTKEDNEEPLILTGRHSILVDSLTTEESKQVKELLGRLYITCKKYRLPACLDEKAKVYSLPGTYNVYHVSLENENMYTNYGMYANGILVETMSKKNIDKC
jgi:hypothetical protein